MCFSAAKIDLGKPPTFFSFSPLNRATCALFPPLYNQCAERFCEASESRGNEILMLKLSQVTLQTLQARFIKFGTYCLVVFRDMSTKKSSFSLKNVCFSSFFQRKKKSNFIEKTLCVRGPPASNAESRVLHLFSRKKPSGRLSFDARCFYGLCSILLF